MNNFILLKAFVALLGLLLIFYLGLYYCGWDAISDLIDYADCNWGCVERYEIAWGIFRVFFLLEIFISLGVWIIFFGVVKS